MKKILLQSFVRVIFLYISMFLLYILSWLIFDYAFPISWRAEIVIFIVAFCIELVSVLWKMRKNQRKSGLLIECWKKSKKKKPPGIA